MYAVPAPVIPALRAAAVGVDDEVSERAAEEVSGARTCAAAVVAVRPKTLNVVTTASSAEANVLALVRPEVREVVRQLRVI